MLMVQELLSVHSKDLPKSSLQGRLKSEMQTMFSERLEQVQHGINATKISRRMSWMEKPRVWLDCLLL